MYLIKNVNDAYWTDGCDWSHRQADAKRLQTKPATSVLADIFGDGVRAVHLKQRTADSGQDAETGTSSL